MQQSDYLIGNFFEFQFVEVLVTGNNQVGWLRKSYFSADNLAKMLPNFEPLVDFFHKSIVGLLWIILVRHRNELFEKVKIEHHVIKFTLVSQQHLQKHLLKWSEHFFASSSSDATDGWPEHVNVHAVDWGIFLANFIHRTHEISQSTLVFVSFQFVFEETNFSKSLIYELLLSDYLGYSVEADTRFYYVLISR